MKISEGFEFEAPGDAYASASFVRDDEAAYFLSSVSFILGLYPGALLVFVEFTSTKLGGYTSTLRATEVVSAQLSRSAAVGTAGPLYEMIWCTQDS